MDIKEIWNQETQNETNFELLADKIYQDIIWGIQNSLREFQTVYITTFYMSVYADKKYTADDFKEIFQNNSNALKVWAKIF